MANIKLIFQGTERTGTNKTELECFLNIQNEITLSINNVHYEYPTIISLDVSTAIKFSKTLRSVINEAKEVSNG